MSLATELAEELVFFIVLYGFDLATDFSVLVEALGSQTAYKRFLEDFNDTQTKTNSNQLLFCSSGPWKGDELQKEIKSFGQILIATQFFTALACFVVVSFFGAFIWNIHRATKASNHGDCQRNKNVTLQVVFGFLCSILQNIPLSCLAVVLYVKRLGPLGLTCWACFQDTTCADKHILTGRFEHMRTLLAVTLVAVVLANLYKGITTFYRWSETGVVSCYEVRACVSIFVGGCYALAVLTPALGLLKVQFFALSSESANMFSEITDRLFMVGVIVWGGFLFAFCCPFIRCVKQK